MWVRYLLITGAGVIVSLAATYATVPSDHSPITLSFDRIQRIGVKQGRVEKQWVFKTLRLPGQVAYDPDLYTAQNEFIEARRQAAQLQHSPISELRQSAKQMIESATLRLKLLGLSDEQIAQLAKRPAAPEYLLLPKIGEDVYIYAEVFEMDLPYVRPGLTAKIQSPAFGGKMLEGKIASVDRVVSPASRTAKARILIPKVPILLRPQMYVDVTILSPLGEHLVVPQDAILDSGTQAWVFVVKPDGRFEPRLVIPLFYGEDLVAIASGLTMGESIVTSANFLIDSESRLKTTSTTEAPSGMPSPPKKTPTCPEGQFWHSQMQHCMQKPP